MRPSSLWVNEWTPLLADASRRADTMKRRFRPFDESLDSDWDWPLLALAAALVVFTAVAWLTISWIKAKKARGYRCPRRLFLELVHAHNLSAADQQLLREIAAWHRLPSPAVLFVEPLRFHSPVMMAALGNKERIAQLAQRLFGKE